MFARGIIYVVALMLMDTYCWYYIVKFIIANSPHNTDLFTQENNAEEYTHCDEVIIE